MNQRMFQARAAATALIFAALTVTSAGAGCISDKSSNPAAHQLAVKSYQRMKTKLQSLQVARQGQAPRDSAPSIVGFWHTVFLADPNGGYSTAGPNVFDEGFDIWSSDGMETLNDISAPPTGNVCLGVWAQTGAMSYSLKHPTWIFDPTNTFVIGVGTISEQVTLDASGNNYSGTSSFDILDLTGASIYHGTASIMAERIVADGQVFQPTPGPAATLAAVVTPASLTTSDSSVVLDGSGSTGSGPLTYFYSVLPGGRVPALLQSPNNPKATVDFVNGPGTYMIQLTVTDSAGHTATSAPVNLVYQGN